MAEHDPTTREHDLVRPLLRTHQVRAFTERPPTDAELQALTDVARWSGSSSNRQPWRFIVVRDPATLRLLAEVGAPSTGWLSGAPAAIAIAVPADPDRAVAHAYDEGRAAERILVAARLLGLGAGISWLRPKARAAAAAALAVPDDHMVRTIVGLGEPAAPARRPRTTRGEARLPREETVFRERWPTD
jgi:nitroreductase